MSTVLFTVGYLINYGLIKTDCTVIEGVSVIETCYSRDAGLYYPLSAKINYSYSVPATPNHGTWYIEFLQVVGCGNTYAETAEILAKYPKNLIEPCWYYRNDPIVIFGPGKYNDQGWFYFMFAMISTGGASVFCLILGCLFRCCCRRS